MGMNYLNGKAIVCRGDGADEYANQFCWLHGSGHIPNKLASTMNIKCQADQVANSEHNERHTQFYLWIPFVLTLLLALIKAPRFIWKEICERGQVKGVVGDGTVIPEKMCIRFNKLRKKKRTEFYSYAYFTCEMLNILCLITCFFIMDSLFAENFRNYGSDVLDYDSTDKNAVDPKCNLFPTLVSCNVQSGLLPHPLVVVGRSDGSLSRRICVSSGSDSLQGRQQDRLHLQDQPLRFYVEGPQGLRPG